MRGLRFILLTTCLVSCVSKRSTEPFYTRFFDGNYDEVWLASLKTLSDYPIRSSNKDSGRIQSDMINGPYNDLFFTYPDPIELPERFRFSLKVNFAKFSDNVNRPVTRVRIVKELEKFQDFYTGWVGFSADGLEERVLLYRIEHILKMEQALSRSNPN